jgi:hypothetical protein
MWKKIESFDDLKNLKKGHRLLKFTGTGSPKDEAKFYNTDENYFCYSIDKVVWETDDIDLAITSEIIKNQKATQFGNLYKKLDDIINEGIWWY